MMDRSCMAQQCWLKECLGIRCARTGMLRYEEKLKKVAEQKNIAQWVRELAKTRKVWTKKKTA
jgi:hypothetical protein